MKRLLALILACFMLAATLASCSLTDIIGGWLNPTPDNPDTPSHTEHVDLDGDGLCDECGAAVGTPDLDPNPGTDPDPDVPPTPEYEDVKYTLNVSELETEKLAADSVNGPFTIVSGTEIRNRTRDFKDSDTGEITSFTKSVKIGGNDNLIKIAVNGTGKLSFIIQNGSSGSATQKVKITAPSGDVREIEFDGTNNSSPLVRITVDVTEGEWTVGRVSGTIDIYYLELNCTVEKSEESGFELVAMGNVDYLVGDDLDLGGLRFNAKYANGKTEALALSLVDIDTTLANLGQSGRYSVTVSYKEYEPITFYVNVYSPESITLGFDAIEQLSKNTSAGNGVYFNHSMRELYFVGDEFSAEGLTVIVSGQCGDNTKDFIVTDYELSGFDSESVGEKTVTVSYSAPGLPAVQSSFKVYVTEKNYSIIDGVYTVEVSSDYSGEIGAVWGEHNMFTTIQQALDFLSEAPDSEKKLILLSGAGEYREKIEITIPNLTIRGVSGEIIIWDSLYGETDASGFVHTTDSTATVAVRESAYNCKFEGVKIYNAWNSLAAFDKEFGEGNHNEHRALALLVQADCFTMQDCILRGYQDTVEFFTGRQYLKNVYISGTTDFIFGTNNTTFFDNCTIHSISNGKTDGGYITAFKGCNKGDADAITYGAIFYKCSFTADDDVLSAGNTALGRCWGKYAAVALIECELGSHVSTKAFDGSSKNERYVSMNAKPTDSTVQFVEYGNTGAGALTDAVDGMRMLSEEEAALYHDFSVIFGKTNGKISYNLEWDPTSVEEVVDNNLYYYFNGQSSPTGTSFTYTGKLEGNSGVLGAMTIDATNGKVAARDSDTQVNAGSTFSFTLNAGMRLTISTYPGYHFYSVNGTAASEDVQIWTFEGDTEIVITADAQLYLYSIIISQN